MDNRREFPRYETAVPLEVVTGAGEVIRTDALDLSRGGLQFGCDAAGAEELFPNGPSAIKDQGVEVDVHLTLPTPTRGPTEIDARGRAVRIARDGEYAFRVGLQFTRFSREGAEDLEVFLLERQRYGT